MWKSVGREAVMPGALEGKVSLVTAAGQGIGRAIAEAFREAGASVLATDIRLESLTELPCRTEQLDVCDAHQVVAVIGLLPRLDILVNCAGYVDNGTVLEATDNEWCRSLDLNVRSMFWTMRAAIPSMLRTGGGCIINIASVASSIKGVPNRFIYGTTKAAVIGMTKSVAADFAAKGIRATAICPGTIDTPSLRERMTSQQSGPSGAALIARQPIGRLGRPEEIAQLAVYLASDAGSFATGATFVVDGGMAI
jgi:2-keto-3-deoxy-L-fuconate dehydrogenase